MSEPLGLGKISSLAAPTLTKGWRRYRHRLAHWTGWNMIAPLKVDPDGWTVRYCVGCGLVYRPSPPDYS